MNDSQIFEIDRFSDLEVALMKVKKRNIKFFILFKKQDDT